jgi:2-polyprenyl-3-methyl-5-hydroxy-6-metoxy-1,4-benzoquinol methylase
MTACPLCQGRTHPAFRARDVNRRISEEWFEYRRCERCGVVFLANVPEDLDRYYPDEYYDLRRVEATATDEAKLRLVRRYADHGHLVEIGTGSGSFAAAASAAGFRVTGIEMNERACRHLREVMGIEAVRSDDPARALASVAPPAVVTLWHAIEHLADPWSMVDSAAAALLPGGILVVATPNPDALQLRVLGARWTHIDAPRHRFLLPVPALQGRGDRE